jgi:phosphatidyl-myo-inositol dimannoside synthase
VGAALGLSGRSDLKGSALVNCLRRVLALVADGLGGHGGIAEYDRQLISSLAACDWVGEVIVLPRRQTEAPGKPTSGVLQLHPVPSRLAYSLAAFRAARAYGEVHCVFCGHLYMAPLAAGIASVFGVPLWIQVHGLEAWDELSRVHRRSLESAALITSVSRYTRRRLLEWIDIEPLRVKVLPNTVDARFRPGPKPVALLDRYNIRDKKILMTVSRLAANNRYKGHDKLINVLPRILDHFPEVVYMVVGDGDDRPRLVDLARRVCVSDKVIFVGRVAAELLPEYFQLADILVMPSTGEGFGIVFLEALASGIDVIGGNVDGSLDPLGDGVLGMAVNPESEEELAQAIRALLDQPSREPRRADRFKYDHIANHLEAMTGALLVARGGAV